MNPDLASFTLERALRGKRVLVTGHTGFKGSWLSAWLLELGATPFGYALAPETNPSMFERIGLSGRMDHQVGDVRDAPALGRRVDETDPEIIVHMAAQALVRESYRDPLATFGTNVMGTANLLEVVRRRGRPCTVVVVTSDKCYEAGRGDVAFTEDDPLGGHDPYSGSKGAAEIVVSAYRHSFFPPERFDDHRVALASVRAGNVIGGGDWAADRIVPDIVRAVAAGERPGLRNPSAVRPWQHVLDALSGYLWLTARLVTKGAGELAEAWNFGPVDREAVTVEKLTEQVLKLWDHPGWQDAKERDAPPEVGYLRLDCGKAVERLGWRPVWNVERAIEQTVAWYRAHLEERDMQVVTAEQIAAYVDAARASGTIWARTGGAGAT